MNKDQMAIYLNEHLEFFNEYPELLKKIKEIKDDDLPIEPMSTLSLADRIIKRVHDDKEHLKSKLEWLFEISRANEKIQDMMMDHLLQQLQKMGFTDQDSCREKLMVDVELNTQGLIYWQQKIASGEKKN